MNMDTSITGQELQTKLEAVSGCPAPDFVNIAQESYRLKTYSVHLVREGSKSV